jgi:hypothetical protein
MKQSSGEMSREDAKLCLRLKMQAEEARCRPTLRHCEERSDEAIQTASAEGFWIAPLR